MSMNVTANPIIINVSYGNVSFCGTISAEWAVFLSCIYIGNTLLGLVLNVMILWALWPEVKNSVGLPFYAANLLCAAILECLVLPFGVSYFLNIWAVGSSVCHVLGLIPKIVQRTAAVILVWMFLLRYIAVKQPLRHRTFSTISVCGSVTFTLWLLIISISVTEHLFTDGNARKCFPDFRLTTAWPLYDLILSFVFNFLPLCLLCIFGNLIYRALKTSPSIPKEQRENIRKSLSLAVFSFGVVSSPMHIVIAYQSTLIFLGQSLCQVNEQVFLPYQFTFALNSYGVVIVPIFYLFSSNTIKEKLKGLFRVQ